MVVVRSVDELRKFIEMGYKPYYHKATRRWYSSYITRGS